MNKIFSSDRPISESKEDRFQRYDFSKRVAKVIIDRKAEESIVIGIYGAWGEGKTSVLNFINNELSKNSKIICVRFNPWRYPDENSLLINFFQTLASILDQKLKTSGERFGELMKNYGELLALKIPIIDNLGTVIQKTGEILSGVELETLKNRIENILKESDSKVVVFIDDIDRLDKTEIHSIFRLVKLTADFPNTVYILSFDDKMVSAAIGERFGSGNQLSGQNFLEKIIQVPLRLPIAQVSALQKFCFEIVENSLSENNIELTGEEKSDFYTQFVQNVMIMLSTPRLALRYGNSLSFSMPLLYKEVNIVDLMLIEAVKIFYPDHYDIIKENPDYFIGASSSVYSSDKDNEKKAYLNSLLDIAEKNLTYNQKRSIRNLLQRLFPAMSGVMNYHSSKNSEELLYKQQRIASSRYFNRYFSYTVNEGDISDVAFKNILDGMLSFTEEELSEKIKKLVNDSSPETFLIKIRGYEGDLLWNASRKLARAIGLNSEIFPKSDGFSFGFTSPNAQAIFFLVHLIKNNPVVDEQIQLLLELIMVSKQFEFACGLFYEFRREDQQAGNSLYSEEEYMTIVDLLISRGKQETLGSSIIERFPEQAGYLLKEWSICNKGQMFVYIDEILNREPSIIVQLLRVFTPTIISTAYKEPYKGNFEKKNYDELVAIIDKLYIKEKLLNFFGDEIDDLSKLRWIERGENGQTDFNIVMQFIYWIKQEDSVTK